MLSLFVINMQKYKNLHLAFAQIYHFYFAENAQISYIQNILYIFSPTIHQKKCIKTPFIRQKKCRKTAVCRQKKCKEFIYIADN